MLSLFRKQGREIRWVLCVLAGGALVLASNEVAQADTRLFPLISISQMYDTNVFYAPKSLLAPELSPEDFVTLINPQLLLVHNSARMSGSVSVGGAIGKYVNNPDLDFAGFNAAASLNFIQMARRFSRRLTNLSVRGTYQFTPSASAFGGGGVGFGGVGFGTAGTVSSGVIGPFDSGLVANRSRVTSYSLGISGGYALSPVTTLQLGYTFSRISFGGQFGLANQAVQNQLFETTTHTGTLGVNTRISNTDTIGMAITHNTFDQSDSGIGTFGTDTATVTWSRQWSRELGSALTGGVLLVEPFDDTSTGRPQQVPAKLTPTASASVTWASSSSALRSAGEGLAGIGPLGGPLPGVPGMVQPGTALARGRYAITASYNYTTFPSYVAQSGPIQTHVVGVRSAVGLTQRVTGQLGLNFARSISSYNQGIVAAFDTYGTTVGLAYLATSALQASLTYNWLNFADRSPNPGAVNNGLQYGFSKHMIMLSLSYVFTQTPGFFRSGGLQETIGTGGAGDSSSSAEQGSGGNAGGRESK